MNYTPGERFYYDKHDFINFRSDGDGQTTLIFLHGFSSSIHTWDDILPFIPRDKFRLVLLDLKGAGFSSKPAHSDYSISANAQIVREFIQQQSIRNYVFVGHSFGGAVALWATLEIKESLNKPISLILIDAAAYKTELPFFVEYLRIPVLNELLFRIVTAEFLVRHTLSHIYYDKNSITEERINRYAFFLKLDGATRALTQMAKQIVPQKSEHRTKQYSSIDIPALLIWGKQDPSIPLAVGQKLANELPNVRLEILDRCGHNPHEENARETAELIFSFLLRGR